MVTHPDFASSLVGEHRHQILADTSQRQLQRQQGHQERQR